MTVGAASTDGNLAPVGVLGKLQVGRLYASDVDAVTARRDAGAWLMLGAALCGCDSWRVDARAVEEAAGVCSRTVARAVARLLLEEVWRELELGRYARGPAWGQPAGPWCEVGPRLLELLEGLGAHPTGLTALRVGLYVLPRLRGARAARAAVCSMTNGRIAGELRMGRTQLTEALRRLEPLGLRCIQGTALRATEDGWRRDPRRVSTSSAPWSHEDWSPPRQKQPNPPQQPP